MHLTLYLSVLGLFGTMQPVSSHVPIPIVPTAPSAIANIRDGATVLYLTAGESEWGESLPPEADTWAVAERFLSRCIKADGGHWGHASASGLCVVFAQRQAALRCAWRLPHLPGLRPADRWRLSLDVAPADQATLSGSQVANMHALAQMADDPLPLAGHRVRDQLLEPLEGEVEDLGLCHLKHREVAQRAYRVRPSEGPSVSPESSHALPGLVLLPPVPLHDSPAHRVFGPLLVDRVAHQLGRSRHVRLINPLSSRALAARSQAREEAHRWLAADYVLSGRYRVVGQHGQGTLQLNLVLHESRRSAVVWEQVFRAQVGDVLDGQSELVHAVSTGVHHAVLDAHMDWARQQTLRNLDDYALLLAGVGLMHRSAPDDFDISRQALLTLLERAPDMGQAHAWLAKWHVLRVTRALTQQPQQEADEAEGHAQRAVVASDAQGLATAMQGFVRLHLRRDLEGALADLQKCTQQHPNEPLAWLFRGVAEAFADHGSQAMQASGQALALSPLDPLLYYFESLAASSAIVGGDLAQARRWCEQSLRRNVMHLSTHRAYITALWMLGDVDAARQAATQLLRIAPGYTVAQFARMGSSASTRLGQWVQTALARAGIPPGT